MAKDKDEPIGQSGSNAKNHDPRNESDTGKAINNNQNNADGNRDKASDGRDSRKNPINDKKNQAKSNLNDADKDNHKNLGNDDASKASNIGKSGKNVKSKHGDKPVDSDLNRGLADKMPGSNKQAFSDLDDMGKHVSPISPDDLSKDLAKQGGKAFGSALKAPDGDQNQRDSDDKDGSTRKNPENPLNHDSSGTLGKMLQGGASMLVNPAKGALKHAPGFIKKPVNKAVGMINKTINKTSDKINSISKQMHFKFGQNHSKSLARSLAASPVVLLVMFLLFGNPQTPYSSGVCSTANVGDSYQSAASHGGDTGGDWLSDDTPANKIAKDLVSACKKHGFSGTQTAAVLGNVYVESGGFQATDVQEKGGGGGQGLFQFTGSTLAAVKALPCWDNSWTPENQLVSFMTLEKGAVGGFEQSYADSSDMDGATEYWCTKVERPGVPLLERRQAAAKQAYTTFNLSKVKGDKSKVNALIGGDTSAVATQNSGLAEAINNAICDNASGNQGDTSSVLSAAKSLEGYFTYSMDNRRDMAKNGDLDAVKKVSDVKKDGQADCSSFVWLACKLAGKSVPSNAGWFTGTMESDAKGDHKWLKEVDKKKGKAGDVIIVNTGSGSGANGHTAILTEDWHGDDTGIINEGGAGGGGGVNISQFRTSFGLLLGQNPSITIAEPVDK